jgi:asparaginyl-tRNA synthetase
METTAISKIGRKATGPATVQGWLYNKRSSGKIQFLIVRDGTGYLQVVVPKAEVAPEVWEAAEKATQES